VLTPFDPLVVIAAAVIVLAAYTLFAITGFGSALVSIPLLAHFLPLDTVVPLILLLDFWAALTTGFRARAEVDGPEVKSVLLGVAVGAVAGVLLLANVPGDGLLVALGTFITCYGMYSLVGSRPITAAPRALALPVGFLGGMLGALFGVGGPIYVAYFGSRMRDPIRLRATLSVVFATSTGLRIALFLLTGFLLDLQLWVAAAVLFPVMIAGTALGRRVGTRLSRPLVLRFMALLLVASGASLLARGLARF
jgi:uncharacterized membrane protein YfcA